MKKILLYLFLIIGIFSLAGCGTSSNNGNTSNDGDGGKNDPIVTPPKQSFDTIKAKFSVPYNFTCLSKMTDKEFDDTIEGVIKATSTCLYSGAEGEELYVILEDGQPTSVITNFGDGYETVDADELSFYIKTIENSFDLVFMVLTDDDVKYENGKFVVTNLKKLADKLFSQSYAEVGDFEITFNSATLELVDNKVIYLADVSFAMDEYEENFYYEYTFTEFGTTTINTPSVDPEVKNSYTLDELEAIFKKNGYECTKLSVLSMETLTCTKGEESIIFNSTCLEGFSTFKNWYYSYTGTGEALEILRNH